MAEGNVEILLKKTNSNHQFKLTLKKPSSVDEKPKCKSQTKSQKPTQEGASSSNTLKKQQAQKQAAAPSVTPSAETAINDVLREAIISNVERCENVDVIKQAVVCLVNICDPRKDCDKKEVLERVSSLLTGTGETVGKAYAIISVDALESLRVDDLKELANRLSMSVSSKLKKAGLVTLVENCLEKEAVNAKIEELINYLRPSETNNLEEHSKYRERLQGFEKAFARFLKDYEVNESKKQDEDVLYQLLKSASNGKGSPIIDVIAHVQ